MESTESKRLWEFERRVKAAFDRMHDIRELPDGSWDEDFACYEPAETIESLLPDAAYFGLGTLIRRPREGCTPREAMVILGQMLEGCRSRASQTSTSQESKVRSDDGNVLTVAEAASFLRIGENTVYDLCKQKRLKHHRIGGGRGTIRLRRDDLEQFQRDMENDTGVVTPRLRHL